MEAGAEDEDGSVLYDVKILADDRVFTLKTDPQSGQWLESVEAGFLSRVLNDDDDYARVAQLPTTLSSAIATAEKVGGGKALEADFKNEDGVAACEVEIVTEDGIRAVLINGRLGAIVKMGLADGDDDDEKTSASSSWSALAARDKRTPPYSHTGKFSTPRVHRSRGL